MERTSYHFTYNHSRWQRGILTGFIFVFFVAGEVALGAEILVWWPVFLAALAGPLFLLGKKSITPGLEFGVLIWLVCALFIKFGISTGTESKIPLSLIIAALWTGLWIFKQLCFHNIKILASPVNLPALAFLAIVFISWPWSWFLADPQITLYFNFIFVQLGTIAVTVFSIVLMLLCANLVKQATIIRWSYWIILAASLVYLPIYLSQASLPINLDLRGLFPLWFCCLSFSLLINWKGGPRWQKILIAIALGGWLFRLFVITIIRISGWLPVLFGMLVILFIYSRKWFALACLAAILIIGLNYQYLYEVVVVAKEQEGTLAGETSRSNLWAQAFHVAQNHLIFGTGPAGYANYYVTYFRELALSTHNNYLDILLQYGSLGLAAFVWLCLAIIYQLRQTIILQPDNSFEKAFVIGCFGGSCGMLVAMWLGDWVIPFAYNQTITAFDYTGLNWLYIGLALALGYIKVDRVKLAGIKAKP